MARKLLSNKKGETLLELVIAMAIFAIMAVWEVSAFGYFAQTGGNLGTLAEVVAMADTKIEGLKAETLTQLNLALPAAGTTSALQDFSPVNNYQYSYARSVDLTNPYVQLVEVVLNIVDKKTSSSVYTLKISFLRGGDVNVGD